MDQLEFDSGFILNPDIYCLPSYRISPFKTDDVGGNACQGDARPSDLLAKKLAGRNWGITSCGRVAIKNALESLKLQSTDCITILTTSGNKYISGCVTREIEKKCKWSRKIENNSAAIFVNHEFGYPYRELASLKKYGLPIIEDACHSFLSDTPEKNIGSIGDFVIYSLPKIFPIQLGGILSWSSNQKVHGEFIKTNTDEYSYISNVISSNIILDKNIKNARINNYNKLCKKFSEINCHPYFDLLENDVPGVFLFKTPESVDLDEMKKHGWRHGIECSVFYGENAFFIPVHQRLTDKDLEYFFVVFKRFLLG